MTPGGASYVMHGVTSGVSASSHTAWQAVARKWFVVFGVTVSADDARLMVEIAYREVR